jgi:hypothetical protein
MVVHCVASIERSENAEPVLGLDKSLPDFASLNPGYASYSCVAVISRQR